MAPSGQMFGFFLFIEFFGALNKRFVSCSEDIHLPLFLIYFSGFDWGNSEFGRFRADALMRPSQFIMVPF